jgi:hypothetical protein
MNSKWERAANRMGRAFVYRINNRILNWGQIPVVRDWLFKLYVGAFVKEINSRFSLQMKENIRYKEQGVEVAIFDSSCKAEGWMPQFVLIFKNESSRVYIKALKLPDSLQKNGIGSYCVAWLKRLCRSFGVRCITVASLEDAEEFWVKMAFQDITREKEKG